MLRVTANPMNTRRRTCRVLVPVNPRDRAAGALPVEVIEIPKAKIDELRDELGLITSAYQIAAGDYARTKEETRGVSVAGLPADRARLAAARANLHRAEELHGALYAEVLRWGISGHDAAELLDEATGEPIVYQSEEGEFDGRPFAVTSSATLAAYRALGPVWVALAVGAVLQWQAGEEPRGAEELWRRAEEGASPLE